MRIGVGVPHLGYVHFKFMECLIRAMSASGMEVHLYSAKSSLLPKNRRVLVEAALDGKCDRLLFLDTDMVFPPDLIPRMVAADKDVVACNCVTRSIPVRFNTLKRQGGPRGKPLATTKESSGLEKVDRCGTGIMMVKMEVFDKVKKPWFMVTWNPKTNAEIGEDYWFCTQVDLAGYEQWIDHDLSKECAHLGEYPYSYQDYVE